MSGQATLRRQGTREAGWETGVGRGIDEEGSAPVSRAVRRSAVVAALLLAGGVVGNVTGHAQAQRAQVPSASAIPVTVTKAQLQDVPVWLRGIGTVQALNTVSVRARVDGTLMQVPVTEGQLVKQGDLLAVIDSRPYQAVLDQALAKQAQDQVQLANAKLDLQRYSSLAKQDFASHQQVDTQHAQVEQFTAALQGDAAMIEAARLNLSYCYIMAPFDGRVGLRQIDPGNLVHAMDAAGIMTITQVHPIAVVFTLPQRSLPAVVAALPEGALPVVAWSDDGQTELAKGTLLTPDNAIDTSTGTIRLKATFANQRDRLWPGQAVEARLLVRTEHQVVAVPAQAVQHSQDALYVYVVKPDSTVQRQVVSAEDHGDVMVITKGIEAGQQIVLDGQSRLENGTLITAATGQQAPARNGG